MQSLDSSTKNIYHTGQIMVRDRLYDDLITYFSIMEKVCNLKQRDEHSARIHWMWGDVLFDQEDFRMAAEHYQHALKSWANIPEVNQRHIMRKLGYASYFLGIYFDCFHYFKKAARFYEELGDEGLWGECLYCIACVMVKLGIYSKAIEHLGKVLPKYDNLRKDAQSDSDLAPLHKFSQFLALIKEV